MLLQAEHSGCGPDLVRPGSGSGSGSTLMSYVTNNIQNQTNDHAVENFSASPPQRREQKRGRDLDVPPQSHTGTPQWDRRTGRQTTGRHIAERRTRNENKPPNHRRDDRKRESQQRRIPALQPPPPALTQLWETGSSGSAQGLLTQPALALALAVNAAANLFLTNRA